MARKLALLIFFLGGFAALSWQVLWQMDLSLALGVSAKGTALTVATVMAGMTLGALWCGKRLEISPPKKPWRLYGILEIAVGGLAWLPHFLMPVIEAGDAAIYQKMPFLATPFSALVLALTIGPSSFAMGATLPVIGLLAEKMGASLSRFYAANTAGAAFGTLGLAYWLMPTFGRTMSAVVLVVFAVFIFAAVWKMSAKASEEKSSGKKRVAPNRRPVSARTALIFAGATGFATFMLEVSWFRMLRSSWPTTTDSFAIMLFVFLVALALGAWASRGLRRVGVSLAVLLALAGIAVLLATPAIERFDLWGSSPSGYLGRVLMRIFTSLLVMGSPVLLLGIALPWLLDEAKKPSDWAKIYGINTIGAVLGSLAAGWFFLGWIGPVKTSWLAGGLLAMVGIFHLRTWVARAELFVPMLMALGFAWWADSGIGETRIQGTAANKERVAKVIAHVNGPDSTTAVARQKNGANVLYIDGYPATGEYGASSNYMDAMGRLPMLLHENPQDALVICFGTGQTARAVLDENPARLTCVDVNPSVFQLAEHFVSNAAVLEDDRVRVRAMDGRAWLRRTTDIYDVVTLEPMPPFFAGVNSLYSVEFYELIESRLSEDGVAAQWFPLHLMTPQHAAAIASAFIQVFPNAVLWIDPDNFDVNGISQQGILLGRKSEKSLNDWPGFSRPTAGKRPLNFDTVSSKVFFQPFELGTYVDTALPVTDDNQILSFGADALHRQSVRGMASAQNMKEFFELKQWLQQIQESEASPE